MIEINGKDVSTSSLSSFYVARDVAATLKQQVEEASFWLSCAVEPLSRIGSARPMKQTKESPNVGDVMSRDVVTVREDIGLEEAARLIVSSQLRSSVGDLQGWTADGHNHRLGYIQGRGGW